MPWANKKEAKYIAAAFLLLCIVSAYRQISIHFFLNDPARPVIVYLVYLLLLTGWYASIRNRVVQSNMRTFLLAEQAIMLMGITTRFVQDAFLYRNTYLMRMSGYWVVIPMILFPLLGLYAAFGLAKSEEHRINTNWYSLLIPAGFLILLILTNESHHIVFRLLEEETQVNLSFHPNVGLFMIIAWACALVVIRIFLIRHRGRKLDGDRRWRTAPLVFAVAMLVFSFLYLSFSFAVSVELIEYSVLIFFLEIMVWESCIWVGMVPVNTHYEEVFDRSSVAMQIVDENGNFHLKSACAPEISPEVFALLKQQNALRSPQGQALHLHAIKGGYVIWQSDISQTLALISELESSAEKLEQEAELLRQELKVRSDEASVKEQNRIYNQLTSEIGEQIILLRKLLAKRERITDKAFLFNQICLIATYIKRRCNLRLIEQSDGGIPNGELQLCYNELLGCLRQMGVDTEMQWQTAEALTPEFAIFTVDLFELLLEYEQFALRSIKVTLETNGVFVVRICSNGAALAQSPPKEIRRINKDNYDVKWQATQNGYQIAACNAGC